MQWELEDFWIRKIDEGGEPLMKDLGGTGLQEKKNDFMGGLNNWGGEDFRFKILENKYQLYYS